MDEKGEAMMTMQEVIYRAARTDWETAMRNWQVALAEINAAKQVWERAQSEFFGKTDVLSSGAGCGTSGGCGGCKGCGKGAGV